MKVQNTKSKIFKVVLYIVLTAMALIMLVPFVWMLSASFKLDKDVFIFPIQWIPTNPRWQNYLDIWTRIPLGKFVLNTVKLTLIVTFLQLLTSSFAAYAFAKLSFKGKELLFMAYIATIAVPWQVYMVPQFMMMRSMGLADTHLSIIFLQAFSAFGVFMMKQFYEGIPTELIYLTTESKKTLQLGLRMFISQFGSEYGLIMAASVLSLIPVLIVFLSLQKYFVEGVAATGVKG